MFILIIVKLQIKQINIFRILLVLCKIIHKTDIVYIIYTPHIRAYKLLYTYIHT